jgi:uncharacterized membrane protein YdjX (TVP38/TMEM64 family)
MTFFWMNQERAIKLFFEYKESILQNFNICLIILPALFTIGQIFMFPAALFTISCGILFGTYFDGNIEGYFLAVIYWLLCCSITGLAPLNISKCILREKLKRYIIDKNVQLRTFSMVLLRYGVRALFLIRLSPILPLAIYNYALGGFDGNIL